MPIIVIDMADTNFTQQLLAAIGAKSQWFDEEELPAVLENYRLLHSCVKNLIEFLLKKSLISPDPYKKEKKISDILPPESTAFTENERAMVMGTRLSDYDNTLDFLCNYYKFSVSSLTLVNIKKLLDLNNAIQWNSFSVNSNSTNTKATATMLLNARQNSDSMTASMVNDSLIKAGKALLSINKSLKELSEFQKELYKSSIRENTFSHPSFNVQKAESSPAEELAQIKKNFTSTMGKIPFYSELIDEIIAEDHAPNKAELQKALLKKLEVSGSESSKQEEKVDTKEIILIALRVFGAMPGQLTQVKKKIEENYELLESEHNSFFDKLKKALRKAFNLEEKPVYYNLTLTDATTAVKTHEKLDYFQFISELDLRARKYASVGVKKAPMYERIASLPEEKVLEYVNQQISECNVLLKLLNALDEFFKSAPLPQNRSKIKGLQMEITSLKNSVVKANQHRSEYTAYIEEEAQLKKLGITNA